MKFVLKILVVFLIFGTLNIIGCTSQDAVESEEEEDQEESQKNVPKEKLKFSAPRIPESAYYAMYFTAPSDLTEKLVISQAKKDGVETSLAKYEGMWSVEVPTSSALEGDYGLVLKSKAKHHAVSSKLQRPFRFDTKQLVVQYEVKFENGIDCGGAYVKLLTDSADLHLQQFNDKTPYTIMFGPDKCGMDYKLHFIFRHKHPKTGAFEEKHAKKPKGDLDKYFTDKKTHLYTLVLNADNTFEIYVDQVLVNSGSLLEDMTPTVNPPKEVEDPNDKKPAEWDERAKIPDSEAKKPEDWDDSAPEYIRDSTAQKPVGWLDNEPSMIPDPNAVKPKDWDDDMDGEWEAAKIDNPKCKDAPGCGDWQPSMIKNPAFKGKWSAPMIDNPNYKGIWKARTVANPDYFEDSEPFRMTAFSAVGLELWSMSDNIVFDNFLITDNKKDADDFVAATWEVKKEAENKFGGGSSVVDYLRDVTNEKPWVWAVVILVVVLPMVLLIVYCCTRSSGSSSDDVGRRKKGDEPADDDDAEEEDEEDVDENPPGGTGDDIQVDRKGKASLEADPEVEEPSRNEVDGSSEEDRATSSEKPASRKRKTRKD